MTDVLDTELDFSPRTFISGANIAFFNFAPCECVFI